MIYQATTEADLAEALRIRYEVQFKPQGLPESDATKHDLDGEPVTVVCKQDGAIVAALTAFILNESDAQIHHLAVLPEHQKKGIGRKLVLGVEDVLRDRGISRMFVMARTYLDKFYGGAGYNVVGEIKKYPGFAENGIFHQKMMKELV